ncbi:MAG TPA: ROK family protein, partial [bacterium]|nr:ROK family protein [bacterium]
MTQVALGIDLGGTDIKAGTVDRSGRVLNRWKKSTEARGGAQVILQRMIELAEEIIQQSKSEGMEIVGIGIGSPGVIDYKNGIVVKMIDNLPGWSGMRLAERFQERLGYPTRIDNDANVCALAECLFGAGQGKSDIVCYTLGTGVGGGIVIDRKVHHGAHGYAAELGHDTVELDGLPCSCGNIGCVEMYASARAIALYAQERLRAGDQSLMSQTAESIEKVTSKTVYQAAV